MDITDRVESHYEALRESRKGERREESAIYGLRRHMNWMKACLIQAFCAPGDRVLDLCCGSGGDAGKFERAGARRWDGVELSETSSKEAERRTRGGNKEGTFRTRVVRADARRVLAGIPIGEGSRSFRVSPGYYDVVACHFALHYLFDSSNPRENQRLVRDVATALHENGRLILVLPDSRVLRAKLEESGGAAFGNSLYHLTPTGAGRYVFSLVDSLVECPENEVDVEELVHHLAAVQLRCVLLENFERLDAQFTADPRFDSTRQAMRPSALTQDETQVAHLYLAAVFERDLPKE